MASGSRHAHRRARHPRGAWPAVAEGTSPTTSEGIPWALDVLFAAADGWWDRGGLRSRWEWLDLLRAAGFREPGFAALHAGHHDPGGVVWASK
ncbi:hypothetical protein L1857_10205 [Amycolatopsis thermalba]|uniref:Methyltransferase n=1 Tax=Amycolatopsis thermalba TaxID=944492 RepID=A0ABY4NT28_9PSEU|nr:MULTISPECIES: hypothetical protein [Amycolatopsis]UQS23163.1 hypothetical protein L1857_10205 [Amycolatopsis thermalba]